MVVSEAEPQSPDRLANWRIAVLALYDLGGATSRKHGEDVAVWCHKFAPKRFSWEHYPEYPNLVIARDALADAKKQKNGSFVTGDEREGWLLTKEGLAWCEANASILGEGAVRRGPSALPESQARALHQLREHRLFEQWKRDDHEVEFYEVADALGFPADAPRETVSKRIEELAGAAQVARLGDVKGFMEWLEANGVSRNSK